MTEVCANVRLPLKTEGGDEPDDVNREHESGVTEEEERKKRRRQVVRFAGDFLSSFRNRLRKCSRCVYVSERERVAA